MSGQKDDSACEHGTAMDVHCCNCHAGFLFTPEECVCDLEGGCMNKAPWPRRARVDLMTPAELAIMEAIRVVEEAGADVRLTDAVVLLGAAQASVADFVDGVECRRSVAPVAPANTD